MNKIFFKDLEILHISKKSLKNSYISISKEAEITLKTPKVSEPFILELLREKESWIRKKINDIKKYPVIKIKLDDEVLLFGKICSIDTPRAIELRLKLEKIKINSKEKTIQCYNTFYKNKAEKYISPRTNYFAEVMGLPYSEIKYRKMKSRWGSCSSKGVLTFNTELIKINKELIDYVIVHELAHIKHMNHSKQFHTLVEKYLPSSKGLRKELKNIKISTF